MMEVLQCKICGGKLSLKEGTNSAECEYCGSVVLLPKIEERPAPVYTCLSSSFIHSGLPQAVNSLPATINCEIGHWQGQTWVANLVSEKKIWDFKCDVVYNGSKSARKIALYVTAYDEKGVPYIPERVFLYEMLFVKGASRTKTWTPCWVNKPVSRVQVTKVKIYYIDGKVQEMTI